MDIFLYIIKIERAGSTSVLHLHGEIKKARSSNDVYDWAGMSPSQAVNNPKLYDVSYEGLKYNRDYDESGFPLRPAIVWFGENTLKFNEAKDIMQDADILVVIGTSLNVYPAASLIYYITPHCKCYVVDPNEYVNSRFISYKENATTGVAKLYEDLLDELFLDSI